MSSKTSIDKAKFLNFLKLITLRGEVENKEALFSFSKDKVKSLLVSSNKTILIRGELNHAFEPVGDIGITNLPAFNKCVDAMDSEFKADFVKNKINLISKKTKVSVVLQTPESIINSVPEEKFNKFVDTSGKGITIVIPKEGVADIIKKFEIVPSTDLILKSKGGYLSLQTKNNETATELFADFEIKCGEKSNFEIVLSKYFILVLQTINDAIVLNFSEKDTTFVHVSLLKEEHKIDYILATKINKEETTAEETNE